MRVLTSALTAAQKARSRHPHVVVNFRDYIAAVRRLAYTRLYTGAEVENYHGAAMPADGSLCRLRLEGTNVEEGRRILKESGLNFVVAESMKDAAEKVVAAAKR